MERHPAWFKLKRATNRLDLRRGAVSQHAERGAGIIYGQRRPTGSSEQICSWGIARCSHIDSSAHIEAYGGSVNLVMTRLFRYRTHPD